MAKPKFRTDITCKVTEKGEADVKIKGRGDDFMELAYHLFDLITEQMTPEECSALWRANIVKLLKSFGLPKEAHEMELRLLEEEEQASAKNLKS